MDVSNYVVILSVPDEEALFDLYLDLSFWEHLPLAIFQEPDLGNGEWTAVAVAPWQFPHAQKQLHSLPLALRGKGVRI